MLPITYIKRGEAVYPQRLLALDMPPEQLWTHGPWEGTGRAVAIVGTRGASVQGLRAAYDLACGLSQAGVAVVSGGALGIDGAAHQGALDGGGRTCVVLGTGVDVTYPQRHGGLFAQVVDKGGCLLSCFPLGTPPKPWHFPSRNRIIAALADAVVVVESQCGSGSHYTAQFASRLGRSLFVLPERAGAAELLAMGHARALCGIEQLLGHLRGEAIVDPQPPVLVGGNHLLHAVLDSVPRDLAELSHRSGLDLPDCAAAVLELELAGLCLRLSGGRYVSTTYRPSSSQSAGQPMRPLG